MLATLLMLINIGSYTVPVLSLQVALRLMAVWCDGNTPGLVDLRFSSKHVNSLLLSSMVIVCCLAIATL